jgi:hypothetical protein
MPSFAEPVEGNPFRRLVPMTAHSRDDTAGPLSGPVPPSKPSDPRGESRPALEDLRQRPAGRDAGTAGFDDFNDDPWPVSVSVRKGRRGAAYRRRGRRC